MYKKNLPIENFHLPKGVGEELENSMNKRSIYDDANPDGASSIDMDEIISNDINDKLSKTIDGNDDDSFDFYENLAFNMPEELLEEIGKEIKQRIEDEYEKRQPWLETIEQSLSYLGLKNNLIS